MQLGKYPAGPENAALGLHVKYLRYYEVNANLAMCRL